MFNGSWKESNEEHITLEIPDENIDVEGKESLKDHLYFKLYIKHGRQRFIGISKHLEESWKYDTERSIFDEIWGVWMSNETLFLCVWCISSIETKTKE